MPASLSPATAPPAVATIASLCRYPIKGFAGQRLAGAMLQPGRGLPFDRFLGIANGSLPIAERDWTIYNAFVRLALNPGLLGFGLDFDAERLFLELQGQDGATIRADLASPEDLDALNRQLAQWFPGCAAPPQLARRHGDLGWWDCADAPISLINLRSVQDLAAKAGVALDPARFRGNLYLDGLAPWAEFDLVGQRLRVGTAELEISRPMERCSATSANPLRAEADCNVPALMGRHLGHLMCGVYAQVVEPGRVAPGDPVVTLGHQPRIWQMGVDYMDAPPTRKWPRFARIVDIVQEDADTRSYWLRDPANLIRPAPLPGQHMRLHLSTENAEPLWRSYTISGVRGDLIRLTIRTRGTAPGWLSRNAAVGETVLVSGPYGEFVLPDPTGRPLVLLSAGIGITPMVSMLQALAQKAQGGQGTGYAEIHLVHSARDFEHLALWPEIQELAEALPALSLRLITTRAPGQERCRIDAKTLAGLPLAKADVMICGPTDFMASMRAQSLAAGADPARLRFEVFASPAVSAKPRAMPDTGPWHIALTKSQWGLKWTTACGSVLEAAEAAGARLSANCRSGVCGACRVKLVSGTVARLVDAPFPLAPDDVLTCCAVPLSDIVLDG